MFKLDLEKAEEPEIKLPKSAGSSMGVLKLILPLSICDTIFHWNDRNGTIVGIKI